MKKNIILLDRDGNMLEYILKHTTHHLVVLVCEMHEKVTSLCKEYNERIGHVIDYERLLDIQHVESIDYQIIAKMKYAQIDIETMLHRIMLDNPLAKDIYHQHLSFFIEIFRNNQIDLMISAEANLTSPNHHIPFSLCTFLGIPCYSMEGYHYHAIALLNHNSPQQFSCIPYTPSTTCAKAEEIIFYKLETSITPEKKNLKRLIKDLVSKCGGEMLSQFCVCLSKLNFQQDRLGITYSYWDKLYYFWKYKQLKRFYQKHSIHPNLQEKYIYYSVHFEPEAAIIGKTLLESQITIIKMLSKALPKGWKLYVKEHPHQFILNNEIMHYFINNLAFFKNTNFYREIMKLENVTMVSLDISSKDLMQNAQAVATLGGTISLESAFYNVPAILFNPLPTVYAHLEHTLHVQSYEDLKEVIQKIQDFPLKDQKINIDKINSYLADPRDSNFYRNLFKTIEDHSKTIKPTGETL
ncbi:hypothetical protein [Helicobacter kayseriensis]|uniref:hypothetical protein n=1 Tax=Helicobacter kayseriensis TaxID=2905877 RepID=UPI001E627CF9|nr:hypothetical protein [Helicobacter kayseriensis]MCE3046657.1 hypothetical protein [Helicobacter kayseriensis]MCE3048041.1 hypothetical protein [Helicobacter kayseriensis]